MSESRDLQAAIGRLRTELRPPWASFGPIVDATFVAAATQLDLQHGLEQVPDGYWVVWADGVVYAEPGVRWTKDMAYMRADVANVHAKLIFYTVRETRSEA